MTDRTMHHAPNVFSDPSFLGPKYIFSNRGLVYAMYVLAFALRVEVHFASMYLFCGVVLSARDVLLLACFMKVIYNPI